MSHSSSNHHFLWLVKNLVFDNYESANAHVTRGMGVRSKVDIFPLLLDSKSGRIGAEVDRKVERSPSDKGSRWQTY
jgi:hypothetical protein